MSTAIQLKYFAAQGRFAWDSRTKHAERFKSGHPTLASPFGESVDMPF
jgi:hypothetical protein